MKRLSIAIIVLISLNTTSIFCMGKRRPPALLTNKKVKEAEIAFDLGVQASNKGDLENAKKYFQRAADIGFTPAKVNLGIVLAQLGEDDDAEKTLKPFADKGNTQAQVNLGILYFKQKKLDDAIHYLKPLADQTNTSESRHLASVNLGAIYMEQKHPILAIKYLMFPLNEQDAHALMLKNELLNRNASEGQVAVPGFILGYYYTHLLPKSKANDEKAEKFLMASYQAEDNPEASKLALSELQTLYKTMKHPEKKETLANLLLQQGQTAELKGSLDEAADLYKQASQLGNKNATIQSNALSNFLQAIIDTENERYDKAVKKFITSNNLYNNLIPNQEIFKDTPHLKAIVIKRAELAQTLKDLTQDIAKGENDETNLSFEKLGHEYLALKKDELALRFLKMFIDYRLAHDKGLAHNDIQILIDLYKQKNDAKNVEKYTAALSNINVVD